MKVSRLLMIGIAAQLLLLTAGAQVTNEGLANKIIEARAKQAAMLRQYNWNCRTELTQNGNVQDIRIELVTVAPNGQLQRTLLNDQPGKLPGGFLRRAGAENKRKDLEKYMLGLAALVDQYTLPSAGKIIDFLSKATVQPVSTPEGTTVLQVSGNNVVVPGDTVTMTLDTKTLAVISTQITTLYNGDPASVHATFKTTPSGLNHLQYGQVQSLPKNATLTLHNFDYVPNN